MTTDKPERDLPVPMTFFDRPVVYHEGGRFDGWLMYQHPDGQLVSLRKPTEEDLVNLGLWRI